MRESTIEKRLVAAVEAEGGFTRKVTYQGRTGAPDRWCFMPRAVLLIVELKRPGEKPRVHQAAEIEKLRAKGFHAFMIDSIEGVDQLIEDWRNGRYR